MPNGIEADSASLTEIHRVIFRIDTGQIIPIHEVYVATRSPRSTIARPNTQVYSGRVLTPKLLGGGRVFLLATEIFDQAVTTVNWPAAAALALYALALVALLLAAYATLTRRVET